MFWCRNRLSRNAAECFSRDAKNLTRLGQLVLADFARTEGQMISRAPFQTQWSCEYHANCFATLHWLTVRNRAAFTAIWQWETAWEITGDLAGKRQLFARPAIPLWKDYWNSGIIGALILGKSMKISYHGRIRWSVRFCWQKAPQTIFMNKKLRTWTKQTSRKCHLLQMDRPSNNKGPSYSRQAPSPLLAGPANPWALHLHHPFSHLL